MSDPYWHCSKCKTVFVHTDAEVRALKFSCATCDNGLERVTKEFADALADRHEAETDVATREIREAYRDARHELRDRFACAALTGITANPYSYPSVTDLAEHCYRLADAMLAERGLMPRADPEPSPSPGSESP